jgi:NTE family protein
MKKDELYALVLPFNNFKIGIPEALSKGMYNFNLLSRITRHVRHVRTLMNCQFLLCIATDIETGKEVLLNKGSLAEAMMASSFPSFLR